MNIEDFNKIYEGNEDLLITVKALFWNRNIEGDNQVVYVEMSPGNCGMPLLNAISKDIDNGKSMVCAVPVAILSDDKSKDFRKELIDKDYVDIIVLIPKNWFRDASTDIALLLLNRENRQRGIVKFIDVTYDATGNRNFPGGWSTAKLLQYDAFPGSEILFGELGEEDGDHDEEEVDLLSSYFDEFIYIAGHYLLKRADHDYSLHPSEYIHRLPSKEGYKLYELYDFEDNCITNAKGLIIHTKDLKDSSTHYQIDLSLIEESEEHGEFYSLNGRYVLLSKQGKLRPTLIDTKGLTIYVPSNEIEVLCENHELNLEYCINELRESYVEKQLGRWRNEGGYLRILRPYGTNEESLELQKKIFVKRKFRDVCEYCIHDDLIDMLAELSDEKIKTDTHIPFKVRNVVEKYVLDLLEKNDIKPEDKDANLDTNIRGYSKAVYKIAPKHVQRSFHTISDLVPEGAHDNKNAHIQKLIREGTAPYLTTTLVYDLINVVVWCKKFENKRI